METKSDHDGAGGRDRDDDGLTCLSTVLGLADVS